MAEEGFKRKLTTILSADVEGYSRLPSWHLFALKWSYTGNQTLSEKCVRICHSFKNWLINILHEKLDSTDNSHWVNSVVVL